MANSRVLFLTFLVTLAAVFPNRTDGHGIMNFPNPRGALRTFKFVPRGVDETAPLDTLMHFPAGRKGSPGAGAISQRAEMRGKGWTAFDPYKKDFVWKSGICGDLKGPRQHHMRGGQFYYGGKIVKTYKQGGILEVGLTIVNHHNGFIEMHVCNADKCGGEISERCYKDGHCRQLLRAKNAVCDSGKSKLCGPIDRNYPGRWYLPCSRSLPDFYEPRTIKYRLPADFTCKHCVLNWFWTTATNCNPPGLIDYFDGPDGPDWGNCPGQNHARGGFTRVPRVCGGVEKFAEEYHMCADISIDARGTAGPAARKPKIEKIPGRKGETDMDLRKKKKVASPSPRPSPYVKPTPKKPDSKKNKKLQLKSFVIEASGKRLKRVSRWDVIDIKRYKHITFRAVTSRRVKYVDFFVNDVFVRREKSAPFYMFGDSGMWKGYWKKPIVNKWFKLTAKTDGARYDVHVKLIM